MNRTVLAMSVIAVAVLAAFGGYRLAAHRLVAEHAAAPAPVRAPAAVAPKGERKVLYWHDPMHPQQKFDKPGKSPFMDMQLVPVYADAAPESKSGIAVNATAAQNLGVRYAEAVMGTLEPRMEALGSVGWNERGVVLVQARSGGFVEKLHARAPLDPVAKGAPLVEILVPEWAGAQEEFLLLRRQGARELADAARQRLVLLGMDEAQIAAVEQGGTVVSRFTLRAPVGGVIAELGAREGMTVMAGVTLFKIVDLSSVWVTAEVPETQATWLKPGSAAEARVPAWPDRVFKGKVGAILPEVNPATRTVRARIEVSNPGALLKPGMFANVSLASGRSSEAVLVPSEAVIRTGERDVVIVADGTHFVPVQVEVGQELGGRSEIRKGLKAGERVVASGQFLIDSEASLKGTLARLEGVPATTRLHAGSGRVTRVDPAKGRLEIAHGPIPGLKWPAMEMEFAAAAGVLAGIAPGDRVDFEMRAQPDNEGTYVLERLRKKAAK